MTTSSGAGSYRRRILVNTAASAAGNVWAMVVTLASLPLLLHGLGATGFGLWALLQTFSARRGWLSIMDLGVGIAATRTIAAKASTGDDSGVARAVSVTLAVCACLGFVGGAGLATLGPLGLPHLFGVESDLHGPLVTAIVIFAAQVPADMLGEGCSDCIAGLQRLDLSRGVDAMRRTLIAAGTSAAALVTHDLSIVALASLLATLTTLIVSAGVLARLVPGWRRPRRDEAIELVRDGSALGVMGVFNVLMNTMDRLVVGVLLGAATVSAVEIAAQITAGADAILAASTAATLPSASWLRARRAAGELRELFERGTKYSLLVTYPLAVAAMVLASPLIGSWVGHGYDAAIPLTVVSLGYTLVAAPFQVASHILQGVSRATLLVRTYVIGTIVNLILTIVFVHAFGAVGAFIASLVACPVYLVPLAAVALRETGSTMRRFTLRAVLPAAVPAAALALACAATLTLSGSDRIRLLIGCAAGAAAYILVVATYSVRRAELAELHRLVSPA